MKTIGMLTLTGLIAVFGIACVETGDGPGADTQTAAQALRTTPIGRTPTRLPPRFAGQLIDEGLATQLAQGELVSWEVCTDQQRRDGVCTVHLRQAPRPGIVHEVWLTDRACQTGDTACQSGYRYTQRTTTVVRNDRWGAPVSTQTRLFAAQAVRGQFRALLLGSFTLEVEGDGVYLEARDHRGLVVYSDMVPAPVARSAACALFASGPGAVLVAGMVNAATAAVLQSTVVLPGLVLAAAPAVAVGAVVGAVVGATVWLVAQHYCNEPPAAPHPGDWDTSGGHGAGDSAGDPCFSSSFDTADYTDGDGFDCTIVVVTFCGTRDGGQCGCDVHTNRVCTNVQVVERP